MITEMELLEINKRDSKGDLFTKLCVERVVANFEPRSINVYLGSFTETAPFGGKVVRLRIDGEKLMAEIDVNKKAEKMIKDGNELAVCGVYNPGDVEKEGNTNIITKFELKSTAITHDKVK